MVNIFYIIFLFSNSGSVKLVVRYTPKVLEEMEARFDRQRLARRKQQSQ